MGREIESYNLIVLTVLYKFKGYMARVTIKNKEPVFSTCSFSCVLIKIM